MNALFLARTRTMLDRSNYSRPFGLSDRKPQWGQPLARCAGDSGIGQRLATGLAEAGADAACFDLPSSEGPAETVQRIEALGRPSHGLTDTPMNLRPEVAEQRKQFEADTPLGRMAEVDELVGPAIFLAAKASSFCTGIDLIVDGGFVCW